MDYGSLVPPADNTRVFLSSGIPRLCLKIAINNDDLEENNETLVVSFNTDPVLGAFMDAMFTYDPTVAEVVIIDNDQCKKHARINHVFALCHTISCYVILFLSTVQPTAPTTTEMMSTTTMFGDPHFNIVLPNKQSLCFTLQGEHGFVFNLVSNRLLQMNALFVPDKERSEVTWLGSIGLVIKRNNFKKSNVTKMRFVADERMIYIGDEIKLHAEAVEKITFSKGKLTLAEAASESPGRNSRHEVRIDLTDLGLSFVVWFVKGNHLDMNWNNVLEQPEQSHGIIGMGDVILN